MPLPDDGAMQLNVRIPAALRGRMVDYNRRHNIGKATEVARALIEAALNRDGARDGRVSARLALGHHRTALLDLLAAVADEDRAAAAELAHEAGTQLLEWAELRREDVELDARLERHREQNERMRMETK